MIASERGALLAIGLLTLSSLFALGRDLAAGASLSAAATVLVLLLLPHGLRERILPLAAGLLALAIVLGLRAWSGALPL